MMANSKHILTSIIPCLSPNLAQEVRQFLRTQPEEDEISRAIGDVLIANSSPQPETILKLFDIPELAKTQSAIDPLTSPSSLIATCATTTVVMFKGDITKCNVDVIVNAANSAGLGCFKPRHRCVDNVIHRAAGPRLREACRAAMKTLPGNELGQMPIITPGFNLPAKYVMHVVGPQLADASIPPTKDERASLVACYWNALQRAEREGFKSIAFPCISTGVFSFPQDLAASLAVETVLNFLTDHNNKSLQAVIFNVFTDRDETLYRNLMTKKADNKMLTITRSPPTSFDMAMTKARTFVHSAKRVLICAGAGMSVKPSSSLENVYVDEAAFKHHYPYMLQYGYHTAYECMGLLRDHKVPETIKWGFFAKHWMNMRWVFLPNESYTTLLHLVKNKDYFIHTSNVDGNFHKSGFDQDKIYTPQGAWDFMQCMTPCRRDSYFPSRPIIDELIRVMDPKTGAVPNHTIPTCPNCHGKVWGNVRGASWFLHTPYDAMNDSLVRWIEQGMEEETVILEIGAGFNTPTVTRFPMEALCRELPKCHLVRINPDDELVPEDLSRKAVGLRAGHDVLALLGGGDASPSNELHGQEQDYVNNHNKPPSWRNLFVSLKG